MKLNIQSNFLRWGALHSGVLLVLLIFSSFAFAQSGPSVTIKAPANNASVSGKVKIDADVTDTGLNAVKTIQFWVNGSYATFPITKSGSVFSMDFDTATIPNGPRPITVVAFDSAGRSNNATVYINVNNASSTPDTTPPTVSFTAPTITTDVSGTITISATATDSGTNASGLLAIFFAVDGKRLSTPITKSGASTFSTTLDTKTLTDASHILEVSAYDSVLNNTKKTLTITVKNGTTPPADTTPPTVTFTSPTATTVGGTITLSANATDTGANASGVLAVFFDVDGRRLSTPITKSGASIFNTTLDTRTLPDGNHTLNVIVYDTALNSKTASLNITVNNTPAPDTTAPTVSITSPLNNATASGTINVNANASDNIRVVGVQFKVDGNNLGAEDTTSPYSVSLNTATLSVGTHSLTAIARDAAGNTKTSNAISIIVSDTTLPTVTISAPAAGATVNGIFTVSATATDNVGVTGVQFKFDGVNMGAEDTVAPYSLQIDTSTTTNGAHTLTAVARDAAGNSKTSNSVSITVNNPDTTKPTVSMTAPANHATVSGTITLSALTGDPGVNASGVQSIQFKVDGVLITNPITKSGATFNTMLNTLSLSNGAHAINVTVFDGAGNSNSATVNVTINNQAAIDLTTGLLGYWKLDERGGLLALDASGNSVHGTLINNPGHAAGQYGHALDFNGLNTHVSITNSPSFSIILPLSLSFWIYPRDLSKNQEIISKGTYLTGTSYGWWVRLTARGELQYLFDIGATFSAGRVSTSTNVLKANTWQHVVMIVERVIAGGLSTFSLRCYINGVLVSSSAPLIVSKSFPMNEAGLSPIIGGNPNNIFDLTVPFNGLLDEVRIYRRALGAPEASALHTYVPTVSSDVAAPSAPANLHASALSASQVILSWPPATDDVAISGYKVFRNNLQNEVAITTGTAYLDTNLSPSTSYTYAVSAMDTGGNESRLSQNAVAQTLSTTPLTMPNLVGAWKFDEGFGSLAIDTSSNLNHGTLMNNPRRVAGRVGNALDFNGSNHVHAGIAATLSNVLPLSLSFWIYPRDLSKTQEVISKGAYLAGTSYGWWLNLTSAGKLEYLFDAGVSFSPGMVSPSLAVLRANVWQHVVITVSQVASGSSLSSLSMNCYVNGVLVSSATSAIYANLTLFRNGDASSPLMMGGNPNNTFRNAVPFNGVLDEVRVIKRIVTPQEITDLYLGKY